MSKKKKPTPTSCPYSREQIQAMILDILTVADYDLAKCYDPETAEEPENIEDDMSRLIAIVVNHLEK